ncbi:membrane dipeptidase [Stemphylium lycopersici]|uniref:Dipeptidase n=1 Tax=Stemphylium lycopersici TaxID=183478 RepID=A0A364N3D9_STELY|nr:membrane dipeptidase [Stemphylium lycopersici]
MQSLFQRMEKNEQSVQHVAREKSKPTRTRAIVAALLALLLIGLAAVKGCRSHPINLVAEVLREVPLIDGHNDFPIFIRAFYYNHIYGSNFSDTADLIGQVDFPKLERSGLGAQFWSAYVECPRDGGNVTDQGTYYESMHQTLQQIDLINRLIDAYPERLQRASSSAEVWSQFAKSKASSISSLMGVEGLHQIANSGSFLRLIHQMGARYVTLTHSCHNTYADSCSPSEPLNGGLSDAGRDVVLEMNRLGLMVDLSHTSVATQRDVFNASRAPVVYTHSSARALCNHPRNVADEELWALKAKRGVIMVKFFPGFVTCSAQATLKDVADHIIYLGELIGFEHVGMGADFDGMGFDSGPVGLEDVSAYPALIEELLRRGVSVADVRGVAGANILRVLAEVEQVARDLINQQPLEDRVKSIF